MATQITHGAQVITLRSGADLTSSYQYFVKQDASGNAIPITSATDVPVGVALNTPASGFETLVAVSGNIKVVAGGAIAIGAILGITANGQVQAITPGTNTTAYQVGRALEAAGAQGVLISALIDTLTPGRAA